MTGALKPEDLDLGRMYGLAQEQKGYFAMPYSEECATDVRALMLGIEVKDLFIEANRMPPRATRPWRHEGTDYDSTRGGRLDVSRREDPIEMPRPRCWRRPR